MTSESGSRPASFLTRMLQGGSLSLIKLGSGLLKIKLLSLFLGAEGLGVLSLALQFQTLSGVFVSLFLSAGVINLSRPMLARGDEKRTAAVMGTALTIATVNTLIFLLIFVIAHNEIPSLLHLRGSAEHPWIVWTLAAAAILNAVGLVLGEPLTMALNRFDLYVRANALSAAADVIIFTVAARFLGASGAVAAILLSVATLTICYVYGLVRLPIVWRLVRQLSFKSSFIKPLLSYSALMIATSVALLGGAFVARSFITSHFGARVNGLLQVAVAFGSYLQPFILNGVYGYLQPIAAELGDCERARNELRQVMRDSLRLAAAGCACVVIGAPFAVPIAYSGDFVGVVPYLDLFFVGEFFYDACLVYSVYLLAVGAKRPYLCGAVVYGTLLLASSIYLAPSLGIWSFVVGHVAGATAVALSAGIYGFAKGHFDGALPPTIMLLGAVNAVICGLALLTRQADVAFWLTRAIGLVWIGWVVAPAARRFLSSGVAHLRAMRA